MTELEQKFLAHHGILGQKWGQHNGPPYPIGGSDHSASEKKAGYKKSLNGGHNEKLYVSEAMRLLDSSDLLRQIENDLENADDKASGSGEYEQIDRLKILYQQGRTREFEKLSEDMISTLKARYRAQSEM